ncbi:MAG TPA: hypothetical protein VMV69_07505 [Pirellulales bacterium]|nr:hypothetical protein [Pirellulales bacterium]
MKIALLTGVCLLGLVGLAGAKFNATEVQAAVTGALGELKFKNDGAEKPGAPVKMKVTKDTIKHLQKLLDGGKTIVVDGNGEIEIK